MELKRKIDLVLKVWNKYNARLIQWILSTVSYNYYICPSVTTITQSLTGNSLSFEINCDFDVIFYMWKFFNQMSTINNGKNLRMCLNKSIPCLFYASLIAWNQLTLFYGYTKISIRTMYDMGAHSIIYCGQSFLERSR